MNYYKIDFGYKKTNSCIVEEYGLIIEAENEEDAIVKLKEEHKGYKIVYISNMEKTPEQDSFTKEEHHSNFIRRNNFLYKLYE